VEQVIILFTESAYNDLAEIEIYISQDSAAVARRFISKIFNKIDLLYNFPEAGKSVRELNNVSIRELLSNKYRIIYQIVDSNNINIVRIVHSSRILDLDI
jgi:addiction module RelE/StbE family toxin